MDLDTSEIEQLAREFADADQRISRDRDRIGRRGAQNIKNAWNADASKSRHFRVHATYDERVYFGATYEAEIGPDRGFGANRLAGIYHFGGANGGGGTGGDPSKYLDDELPTLEKYLAEAAEKALLR